MSYQGTGIFDLLEPEELHQLDERLYEAQAACRAVWPVSQPGLYGDLTDARREVNAVFPWGGA